MAIPHECGAEESTLRRWKLEYPPKISALAAFFESFMNVSKTNLLPPLQRLYIALVSLAQPPPNHSRLAWAFIMSQCPRASSDEETTRLTRRVPCRSSAYLPASPEFTLSHPVHLY